MVGHQNGVCADGVAELSLGRQGMVGHQNDNRCGQEAAQSLGRQGMVGHQNCPPRWQQTR